MIEDFSYITEDGIVLQLHLEAGVNKFKGIQQSKIDSFFKGQGKGVKWKCHDHFVQILEAGRIIDGFPTSDRKQAIVIYPFDHLVYAAPSNAVIFDCDGRKRQELKVPTLTSEIAKERKSRMKNYDASANAYFRGVYWSKDKNGKPLTIMTIDFDWEWWESRVLDLVTCEFGECVGSGRR